MLFNSLHYALFLPTVAVAYFCLPARFRWALLLLASGYFYAFFMPAYLAVLMAVIGVDYAAALLIQSSDGWKRRLWLSASIAASLSLLALFRYTPGLLPPIGLSFYTLQSMSYTIEVYCGRLPAERHFGYYAAYVMYFPKLLCGPIERPQHLLPQLRDPPEFRYASAVAGLRLILLGLFKKTVLADNLAIYVDDVFAAPQQFVGPALVLAAVLHALQLYFDFSGYTDIARGSSSILGIQLSPNFRMPYFATSVADFWRRWNITLTGWFRDYVYLPLLARGSARPQRHLAAVLLVFLLSGLWHGAGWTFVIWGLLHGFYMVAEFLWRASSLSRLRLWRGLQIAATFSLCCFAFIFFRARDAATACYIVGHLPRGWQPHAPLHLPPAFNLFLVLTMAFVVLEWNHAAGRLCFERLCKPFRWMVYYLALFLVLIFGRYEMAFLYYQF